jgi:hypothetical protein
MSNIAIRHGNLIENPSDVVILPSVFDPRVVPALAASVTGVAD